MNSRKNFELFTHPAWKSRNLGIKMANHGGNLKSHIHRRIDDDQGQNQGQIGAKFSTKIKSR